MCRAVLAAIALIFLGQALVAETLVLPTVVAAADELPQVCPRPDAPYAATPVGLVTSPANTTRSAASTPVGVNDCLVVTLFQNSHNISGVTDTEMKKGFGPPLHKMAVTVVSIRPNGNLVIEGRNEVFSEGKIYSRHLTGEVRPEAVAGGSLVRWEDIAEVCLRARVREEANEAPADVAPQPHPVRQVAAEVAVPSKAGEEPHPVQQVAAQIDMSPKVVLLRQKQEELAKLQQEVQRLQRETGTSQQILVKVQMLEVSLTEMEKLGIDTSLVTSGIAALPSGDAKQLVHALVENNVAKVVAEPNILALDGRLTSIHSGGEIPYPALNGSAGATEMQPVGIKVDVLPQSLADNRVRMDLKVRKCEPDFAQTVDIHGTKAPVLQVQQMNTAVEAAFDQSVVLAGLVETRTEEVKRGRNKVEIVEHRTEVVFIVTPEIVSEVAAAPKPVGANTPK